jgi:acetyltransferase-like isoleucine patch superfamily enzyme
MSLRDKLKIIYSWFVRQMTIWLPDVPIFQSFRGFLYSLAMKKCGARFRVCHNVILNRLELLEVGSNVYFAPGCVVAGGGDIVIGDNVLFGPNVVIAAANHKFDGVSFVNGYFFGKVVIADNCWIGANVSLLMGTSIPASSIVGAGSVCNKNLETPFSVYAGNPIRFIKSLNESVI